MALMSKFVIALLPLAMVVFANAAEPDNPKSFRAGAATSNITPFLGTDLIGGFSPRGSTHIHDELHARCLVLDDGETKLAIVIVDNVKFPTEVHGPTKELIQKNSGLPPENVLIAATHTHSAPSLRGKSYLELDEPLDEYQKFVIRRIADGVQRAINNLEPARIGWGVGEVPQHVFNRRWLLNDGQTVTSPFGEEELAAMNPGRYLKVLDKPAGPVNPKVYVLSVKSIEGRPIAVLANYWLHYVGGVGQGHVSADYFGEFADRLQQLLAEPGQEPPFVGMMSNGASADVNNNDYANYGKPGRKRYQRYEKIREVAEDLAREVARVEDEIKYRDWAELGAAAESVTLKRRRPTPEQVQAARHLLENAEPAETLLLRGRSVPVALLANADDALIDRVIATVSACFSFTDRKLRTAWPKFATAPIAKSGRHSAWKLRTTWPGQGPMPLQTGC